MGLHDLIGAGRSHWFEISVVIQIALLVHAIKTGRPYWWIWIILCFPFLGSAAYALVELAPDLRRPSLKSLAWRLKPPGRRIALLREVIEQSDTFANRVALAEEFYRQKKFQDAVAAYEASLCGLYQDDPYALLDLAQCCFDLGQYERVRVLLEKIDVSQARELTSRRTLLEAKTCDALDLKVQALELYASAIPKYLGEEARYRQAVLLHKMGQKDQAAVVFEDILKKYRTSGSHWRKEQKTWYRSAKAKLKEIVR
jgi:hypothetical protein